MVLENFQGRGVLLIWKKEGARAYCACSRCGRGCLDIFLSSITSLSFSLSLWETARYRLKILFKGPLKLKQTNHLFLAVLENSVLEVTSLLHHHEKHRMTFGKSRYAT